jgi:hypothetical protein
MTQGTAAHGIFSPAGSGVVVEVRSRQPQVAAPRHGVVIAAAAAENFREKYNRFTMENARQLQCKALCMLRKIRRRKNNGKQ